MPDKQMLNMLYDGEPLKRIDDFRFANRFESRTEAIRWLVQAALDNKLTRRERGRRNEAGGIASTGPFWECATSSTPQ